MTNLSSCSLSHESTRLLLGRAIGAKAEPFDMGMGSSSILACVALYFTDLNHGDQLHSTMQSLKF